MWHQNEDTRSGIGKQVAQMFDRLSETRLTHHKFEMFNVKHLEKDIDVNGMIQGNVHLSDKEGSSSSRTRL